MLRGRYINLDRSTERREALERDLMRYGAAGRYVPFRAIDGASLSDTPGLSKGQLGCLLSHLRVLQQHAQAGEDIHVIEDDVVFGPRTVSFMDQAIGQAVAAFDLVYTEVSPVLDLRFALAMARTCRNVGLEDEGGPRAVFYQPLGASMTMATTSYVVSGRAVRRLAAAVEREFAGSAKAPIDVIYHRLIASGEFTACCTAPFFTSVRPPDQAGSTIDAEARPMDLVAYLIRAPFFVDRDDAAISARLARLGVEHPEARGPDAVGEVMRYLFTKAFELPGA